MTRGPTDRPTILVLAKEPVPGRVKTRLCPPCTPDEAASIATAAIEDTLRAATAVEGARVVLVLDGEPGRWVPPGVAVVPQRGATFADRLADAWSDVPGPAVQIGMDTPQVTPTLLGDALDLVARGGARSVLGLAEDGGWWLLGMRDPDPRAVAGIETSRADTGERQLHRLRRLGLEPVLVPTLRDVDTFDDLAAVVSESSPAATTAAARPVLTAAASGG